VALFVEDRGTGVPVVLLHSSGMSGRQWRRTAAALVEGGLRAVVPDLSGHGQSPEWPEPRPFSFHVDVNEVADLLSSLGQAHLVGHSYGGFIALLAALAAPAQVRSLAVYDPVAMGTLESERDRDARADLSRVAFAWDGSADGCERWLEMFVDYWMGAGGWAALREDARAEFRRVGWVVYEGARTLVHDSTPASAYGRLSVPVLLLGGGQSPLAARRVVSRLHKALPGARTEVLKEAGHMGPLTHPARINDLLVAWCTATNLL
jgi:pimeloyl-ACP methyl ester carboxylesterase